MMFKQLLDREKAMKKVMIAAMVFVLLLTSIGGCWVPYEDRGRDGHHRDGRYDRDPAHRGPEGGGPGGGGHGGGGPGGGH